MRLAALPGRIVGRVGLVLATLAWALPSGGATQGGVHGNSRETATNIEPPASISGQLGDKVHYFRLEFEAPGFLTALTTGETDTAGTLYRPDGEIIVDGDASLTEGYVLSETEPRVTALHDRHDHNFRIVARVEDDGPYFLTVSGQCNPASEGSDILDDWDDWVCETGEYVLHVLWSPER